MDASFYAVYVARYERARAEYGHVRSIIMAVDGALPLTASAVFKADVIIVAVRASAMTSATIDALTALKAALRKSDVRATDDGLEVRIRMPTTTHDLCGTDHAAHDA